MKTILVPTDFSTPAQNALEYAVELAKENNSTLVLLNVFTLSLSGYDALAAAELVNEAELSSTRQLFELRDRIIGNNPNLNVRCFCRSGSPKATIEEVASTDKVDIIVMGITGQAGFMKEKVIGSTTLDIARDSNVPLMIIPEGIRFNKINTVSFACDVYNLQGSSSVERVKEFCVFFNAKLEIVNLERSSSEDKPIRVRNKNFIESILVDLDYEFVVLKDEEGDDTLLNHFINNPKDIIVLNPKKQNLLQSVFHKSMTKNLAFHVKTPMLIVH